MIRRGCLLLLAIALVGVPAEAQGGDVPLDADLPLVFVRTLDGVLLEVLKGLQPVIPPAALQPAQAVPAPELPEPLTVGPFGIAGLRLGPAFDLADLGLDTAIVVGEPAAGLALRPTLPVEGGLALPAVNPASALPDQEQPLRVDARLAATAAGPGPVEVEVAAAAAGPAALDDRFSRALARLRAGDASPDVIAQVRSLPREDLLSLIAGTPNTSQNEGLVDALTAILVDQHSFGAESTSGIDDRLLLRLGVSLARMGKPDAVPILEGLLAQRNGRAEGNVPELAGLAVYYRAIGQVGKAAETLLRIDAYSASVPVRANTRVDAARIYLLAGDREAARHTYAQVAAFGYGWATGMAVYDQAREAIHQGRYAEAREILATPVVGEYAEQTQVALVHLQGEAFRREGDATQAAASYRRALELYDALEAPLPNEGLEAIVAASRRRLSTLERDTAKD